MITCILKVLINYLDIKYIYLFLLLKDIINKIKMVKKKYVFEIRNSNKVLIKTKLKLKNLLKKIKYMILIKKIYSYLS